MEKVLDRPVGNVEILGVNLDSATAKFCVEAQNNDIATFDDVIGVFVFDAHYDQETALRYTTAIHKSGSSVCYWNDKPNCDRIVASFARIKVTAKTLEV